MAKKKVANSTKVPRDNTFYVEKEIYWNDYLLGKIIKNIHPLERLNVELASKRLRQLSVRTPCFKEPLLEIEIRDKFKSVEVGMLRRLVYEFKAVRNIEILLCKNPIEKLMTCSKLCKNSIRSLALVELIMDPLSLRVIERYLPNVSELQCDGFSQAAIVYLSLPNRAISKQIQKFTFSYLYSFGNPLAFFTNLKEIQIFEMNPRIFSYLITFKGKVDIIFVCRVRSQEIANLLREKCNRLELYMFLSESYNSFEKRFFEIDSLYCLRLVFCEISAINRSFLKDCDFKKLEKLVIRKSYISGAILIVLSSKLSAAKCLSYLCLNRVQVSYCSDNRAANMLTEEEIRQEKKEEEELMLFLSKEDKKGLRRGNFKTSICRILPRSLKTLIFRDILLTPLDFEIITMRGSELEFLGIIYYPYMVEQYCYAYAKMLKRLTNLKKFLTNVDVDENVIETILDPSCKLEYVEFNFDSETWLQERVDKSEEVIHLNYNKFSEFGTYSLMFPNRYRPEMVLGSST